MSTKLVQVPLTAGAFVRPRGGDVGALKQRRVRHGVTQAALAKKLRSSQSGVAKMEAGDPSISLDLLLRAFFATGATKRDLARVLISRRCQRTITPVGARPPSGGEGTKVFGLPIVVVVPEGRGK